MTSHGDHALDVIVAERACERLLYEYARCIDRGDAADVAELFTDDAVWLADDIDMRGREAIRKAFSGRQSVTRRQSRHVITNVLVDLTSNDEAQGVAYLVNYRHDSATGTAEHPAPADHPKLVGEYHLEFRHVDGAWRIASLRFDVAFLRSRPG